MRNGENEHIFIHDFFGKMTKEQIGILVYIISIPIIIYVSLMFNQE